LDSHRTFKAGKGLDQGQKVKGQSYKVTQFVSSNSVIIQEFNSRIEGNVV